MATIQTFGVDADDIRGKVQGTNITSATTPSTSDVEELITQVASMVQNLCQSKNITVAGLSDTDDTYQTLKFMVIYKVAAEVLVSRDRGVGSSAQYYLDRYNELKETIVKQPQQIQQREDGPDYFTSTLEDKNNPNKDNQFTGVFGAIVRGGF